MSTITFYIVLAFVLVALVSYLLGSVNTAIIISRIFAGDDVRKHGSGNAGMTNMLRTYGKGPAILTAMGDFFKAVVAVLLSRLLFGLVINNFLGLAFSASFNIGYISSLFVILGHMFPLYFNFKGGKGVMTTIGVMFIINPFVFLILMVIFIPFVFIVKIVSLASVVGALCYPVVTFLVLRFQGADPVFDTVCSAIIAAIIIYMHRENIGRLLSGTEKKLVIKPKEKKQILENILDTELLDEDEK